MGALRGLGLVIALLGCLSNACDESADASDYNPCLRIDQTACEADASCSARYGMPHPEPLDDNKVYAGCATRCSGEACEVPPDATACALSDSGQCWTLTAPPAPDGWTLLGVDEECATFSQCDSE